MTFLGSRASPPATISNDDQNPYGNGFWVVTFDAADFGLGAADAEVYHMALRGPTGSVLDVYVDQTFYETTERGDINSWDANHPLYLRGGQQLHYYWNSAGTPAPKVTIWLQTPQT